MNDKTQKSFMISAAQAILMGWTPGQLRVLANSLERIAKREEEDIITYQMNRRGDLAETSFQTTNFNPGLNRQNAYRFRNLASEVERLRNKKVARQLVEMI